MPTFALGERVLAVTNGTGEQKSGVVTAVLAGAVSSYLWNGEERYMVRFDGDDGPSGPCVVHRAEGTHEDTPPRSGTAA